MHVQETAAQEARRISTEETGHVVPTYPSSVDSPTDALRFLSEHTVRASAKACDGVKAIQQKIDEVKEAAYALLDENVTSSQIAELGKKLTKQMDEQINAGLVAVVNELAASKEEQKKEIAGLKNEISSLKQEQKKQILSLQKQQQKQIADLKSSILNAIAKEIRAGYTAEQAKNTTTDARAGQRSRLVGFRPQKVRTLHLSISSEIVPPQKTTH